MRRKRFRPDGCQAQTRGQYRHQPDAGRLYGPLPGQLLGRRLPPVHGSGRLFHRRALQLHADQHGRRTGHAVDRHQPGRTWHRSRRLDRFYDEQSGEPDRRSVRYRTGLRCRGGLLFAAEPDRRHARRPAQRERCQIQSRLDRRHAGLGHRQRRPYGRRILDGCGPGPSSNCRPG